MIIYTILITISITAIFYSLYSLFQSSYKKSQLNKRLVTALIQPTSSGKSNIPDNKSQLTDILSKKLNIIAEKIVPKNIINNIQKNITTANIKDFDISKYFLMKVLVDSFAIFIIPLLLIAVGSKPSMGLIAMMAIGGFFLPDMQIKSSIQKRHQAITKALPNFIDLLRLCVEAGLDLESAFGRIVKEDSSILQPEAAQLFTELKMGKPLSEGLRDMSERLAHPDFTAFSTILLEASEMGMSIASVLRTQEEAISLKYIQALRAKAGKTPVLILLPMVVFILPVLFIILLGPAGIQIMGAFS